MYDYILLLDKEIELFWKRKVTGASLLFLVNRYLPIIAYIIRPVEMIPMSCSVSGDVMCRPTIDLPFFQRCVEQCVLNVTHS